MQTGKLLRLRLNPQLKQKTPSVCCSLRQAEEIICSLSSTTFANSNYCWQKSAVHCPGLANPLNLFVAFFRSCPRSAQSATHTHTTILTSWTGYHELIYQEPRPELRAQKSQNNMRMCTIWILQKRCKKKRQVGTRCNFSAQYQIL